MSEEKNSMQCSYCGATLEIIAGATVLTCPSCNTVNPVVRGKQEAVIQQYMLALHLDKTATREALVGDLSKLPNSRPDLSRNLTFSKAELKYLPFYLVDVKGSTFFEGKGRSANYANWFKTGYQNIMFFLKPESDKFEDMKQYVLYAGPQISNELTNYSVAARGRVFFDKQEADRNGGEIIVPILNEPEARERAKLLLKTYHDGIIHEEISQIDNLQQNFEVTDIALIFAPVWFVNFKLAGTSTKTYTAIIDGSSGRTIYTQTPGSQQFYLLLAFLTICFALLGISGIAIVLFFKLNAIGTFIGITGLGLSAEGLFLGTRQSFKEKST